MSNSDIRKIEKEISKLSLKRRLSLLQLMSKNRIGFYGPVVIKENNQTFTYQTYQLGLLSLLSIVFDKYTYVTPNHNLWLYNNMVNLQDLKITLDYLEEDPIKGLSSIFYLQMYLKQFLIMIYRSDFFYNYNNKQFNLKQLFYDTYKCDYSEFLFLYVIVLVFSNLNDDSKMFEVLKKITPTAFKALTISDVEFRKIYKPYKSWTNETLMSYNFLLRYPFILYNKEIFLPHWPAVAYSITESLMFDITRKNIKYKEDIGKYVFEDYIYHITKSSKINNNTQVLKEFSYGKDNKKTSDIIVINNNELLLVEAKFINFKLLLRLFDEVSIDEIQNRMSNFIVQVYKVITAIKHNKINHNDFPQQISDIRAVIVIYDDYNLDIEKVYEIALDQISEDKVYIDEEEIKKTICFTPIYEYERIQYFSDLNVVSFYQHILDDNQYFYKQYQYKFTDHDHSSNMPFVKEKYLKLFEETSELIKKLKI